MKTKVTRLTHEEYLKALSDSDKPDMAGQIQAQLSALQKKFNENQKEGETSVQKESTDQ